MGLGFCFSQQPFHLGPEFHQERREAVRKKMPDNSVAVFFANPVRNRSNDVDYLYHQDPNFFYLTGYREPNALLLIFKKEQQDAKGISYNEAIFVQPRDPRTEMWMGKRLGPQGVGQLLGFEAIYENTDFSGFPIDFSKFDKVLFFDFQNDVRNTKKPGDLFSLIQAFKSKAGHPEAASSLEMEPKRPNLDSKTLVKIMADLREIKTPDEIYMLRKAVAISAMGQNEVMKAMKPGMSERTIQAIHEMVYKMYDAEDLGYPSIVGAGHNGCVLHYIDNYKTIGSEEMVLMDLGAQYHGYTADVTRTIPVDGKFSPEQKIIYELVLKSQQAAMDASKPGVPFTELDRISRTIINQGLADLGITKKPNDRHLYFPHGMAHHIGLDVHDPGNYKNLEENMVITIEPGIYIPAGSDCDPKWWDIAVRIEDDILITNDGHENLSGMSPRSVAEIEAMMALPSALDQLVLPELDIKE